MWGPRVGRAILAALPLLLLAADTTPATPPPYVDKKAGFQILVPDGWKPVTLAEPPHEVLLLVANDTTGQQFVVSKIVGPNEKADRDPKLLQQLEEGIKAKVSGYKRISATKRSFGKAARKTPGYDLWFRVDRDGTPVTMGARFLFYRGYAISVMVDAPGKAEKKAARAIVDSFGPIVAKDTP